MRKLIVYALVSVLLGKDLVYAVRFDYSCKLKVYSDKGVICGCVNFFFTEWIFAILG